MRTRPILETSDIANIIAHAKAEAQKNGWNVSIAIVNDSGNVIHVEIVGEPGVPGGEVALAKARAAALTKRPTKELEERMKDRPGFVNFLNPANLLQVQGGLPIIYKDECVGGIGVSGRPSHEDEIVARAGLVAIS